MAGHGTSLGGGARSFPPTSWSLVRGARGEGDDARAHVERLVSTYWKPVYWYVRTMWHKSNEDAKDLTQEFFATILARDALGALRDERIRFRAFVRGCLENFLKSNKRDGARLKRGGGAVVVAIDDAAADLAVSRDASPEDAFDAAWAETVLQDAVAALERLYRTSGRADYWEVFARLELGDEPPTYEACAAALGLKRDDVHNRLRHARRMLRDLVRDRVRETLASPDDLEDELRALAGRTGTRASGK